MVLYLPQSSASGGKGDYDLKLDKLTALAKVFDVSVSEFIKEK